MSPKSVAEIGVATRQEYGVATIVCTDNSHQYLGNPQRIRLVKVDSVAYGRILMCRIYAALNGCPMPRCSFSTVSNPKSELIGRLK